MTEKTNSEVCELCEGTVELCRTQARFRFKGETVYVENVPAWVCVRCGKQYFDVPVYKRLEEIARQRHRLEKTVCFPLAEYDTALS